MSNAWIIQTSICFWEVIFGFYKPVDYPCTTQNYLLWYPVWSTVEEISHCFHFLQYLENHKCDSDDPHKAFLGLNITLLKKKKLTVSSQEKEKYSSIDLFNLCYGAVCSTRILLFSIRRGQQIWTHTNIWSMNKYHIKNYIYYSCLIKATVNTDGAKSHFPSVE